MNKKFIVIAAIILTSVILIVGGINIYRGIKQHRETSIEYKIPDEVQEAADILK